MNSSLYLHPHCSELSNDPLLSILFICSSLLLQDGDNVCCIINHALMFCKDLYERFTILWFIYMWIEWVILNLTQAVSALHTCPGRCPSINLSEAGNCVFSILCLRTQRCRTHHLVLPAKRFTTVQVLHFKLATLKADSKEKGNPFNTHIHYD